MSVCVHPQLPVAGSGLQGEFQGVCLLQLPHLAVVAT